MSKPESKTTLENIYRTGCGIICFELNVDGKSINFRFGKTKYSGYIKEENADPELFDGEIINE